MFIDNLPEGWTWSKLGAVTQINGRDIAIRDLPDNLPVTFLPMAAVDAEQGYIAQPKIRLLKEVRKGFTPFSDGDVLFAKITPSMENGKAAIARKLKNGRGFGSTEFHVFHPKEVVTAEWIFYFVRQKTFRKDAKAHFAGTAGQLRVPASFLVDYPIPVPPLPEQECIVAKIEELFTQLEAGTRALRRLQAALKRYKASVLKAAFKGKLLVNSRIENSDGLPKDWKWMRFNEITQNFDGKRVPVKASDRDNMAGKYPYYGASGIIDNVKDYLFDGDYLLIAEDGANLFSRNSPITFQAHGKFWVNNHAHIVKTLNDMPLAFLEYYILSLDLQFYITGTAQPKLTQANMNKIPIPLPPLAEQRLIVAEVERRLSVAKEIEVAVAASLARAARLRQVVLKNAFEGKLA